MEDKITLGKFIARKRKEADMTQKQMADALYVTESAISKWERGLSYPDITLVTGICETLHITEHELITASEDHRQHKVEKQAKSFVKVRNSYLYTLYGAYGIALLSCFIVNLAVFHTLSWFFIVLTSLLLAFCLTCLPVLVPTHKGSVTCGASLVSLLLLLMTCSIYTGGGWFGTAAVPSLYGCVVVFLPLILRELPPSLAVSRHKALLCMLVDSLMLFAVFGVTCKYAADPARFWEIAVPISLYGLMLPWALLLICRYLPIHNLFRAALSCFVAGPYLFCCNSVIDMVLEDVPFRMPVCNLGNWSADSINGNIFLILLVSCMLGALLFTAGGILCTVRKQK